MGARFFLANVNIFVRCTCGFTIPMVPLQASSQECKRIKGIHLLTIGCPEYYCVTCACLALKCPSASLGSELHTPFSSVSVRCDLH